MGSEAPDPFSTEAPPKRPRRPLPSPHTPRPAPVRPAPWSRSRCLASTSTHSRPSPAPHVQPPEVCRPLPWGLCTREPRAEARGTATQGPLVQGVAVPGFLCARSGDTPTGLVSWPVLSSVLGILRSRAEVGWRSGVPRENTFWGDWLPLEEHRPPSGQSSSGAVLGLKDGGGGVQGAGPQSRQHARGMHSEVRDVSS